MILIKIPIIVILLILLLVKINKFTTTPSKLTNIDAYKSIFNLIKNDINKQNMNFNGIVNSSKNCDIDNTNENIYIQNSNIVPSNTIIAYYYKDNIKHLYSDKLWWSRSNIVPNGWVLCDGNTYYYDFDKDTYMYHIYDFKKDGTTLIKTPYLSGGILTMNGFLRRGSYNKIIEEENIKYHNHTIAIDYLKDSWITHNIGNRTDDKKVKGLILTTSEESSDSINPDFTNNNKEPLSLIPPIYTMMYIMKI